MIEQTLILIKPDGVKRGLIGEIIKRFEQRGLKIIAIKMVQPTPEFSKKHYSSHINKSFYKNLEKFITSGPVVAMIAEGISAVTYVRKMCGDTEPATAQPGTIRGDFAHHTYAYTDKKGISITNLVHASGTIEEAKQEIKLWFSKNEMFLYERDDEAHHLG